MLSTKGKYALRIMVEIALAQESNDVISLKSIVDKENLSQKYLEQVVGLLTKSHLLISVRGNNGGYKLAKPAKDYSVFDILSVAEGSLLPVPNINDDQSISSITKSFFSEYNSIVENYLRKQSLSQLVDNYKNTNYELDYCI